MKHRLIAGTINHWPDDDVWRNWHLDISNRGVWSKDLDIAVQPDFVCDLAHMPMFRAAMFDEVRAHHVFEHIPADRTELAVAEVYRVLVPDGVFDVEVPDVARVATAYATGELDYAGLQQWLYGEQLANHEMGDSHRQAFTEESLRSLLTQHDFLVDGPEESGLAVRFRARRHP